MARGFGFIPAVLIVITLATAARGQDILSGPATARSGDSFNLAGTEVQLFDVMAVVPDQSCVEWRGPKQVGFPCGLYAKAFLESLIADKTVTCVPRERLANGRVVASCFVEGNDLSSAVVVAGWAVTCKQSSRYVLQEEAARASRKGIWLGNFEDARICYDAVPPGD